MVLERKTEGRLWPSIIVEGRLDLKSDKIRCMRETIIIAAEVMPRAVIGIGIIALLSLIPKFHPLGHLDFASILFASSKSVL